MTDPGYVNYQDPRLQPPEDDEDMTPTECWERCIHGAACMGLLMHLTDSNMLSIDKAVETMGCAECVQWEDMG